MAYTPTQWKDRVVERPRTYRMQDNGDGTITLIPEPGTIYEPGTPVNAANLNKLENGLQAAAAVADSAMPKSGGQFTGRVRPAASTGNIGDSGSSGTNFEVVSGSTNDDAFMAFHVPNNFAFKFGIDRATKRLAVGGWSLGANKYKLWDERDLRVNDGVLEFFDGGTWRKIGIFKILTPNPTGSKEFSPGDPEALVFKYVGPCRIRRLSVTISSNVGNWRLGIMLRVDGNSVFSDTRPPGTTYYLQGPSWDFSTAIADIDIPISSSFEVSGWYPAGGITSSTITVTAILEVPA